MSSSAASPALIKGYLPLRVKIPSTKDNKTDETFFFVKEHRESSSESSNNKKNATLFIANAPVVPMVRTRLLLKSLLGRFGDISRVTVIPNPRAADTLLPPAQEASLWTNKFQLPSFLVPKMSEGKFAHVVFTSNKEMRRAMRSLTQVMSQPFGEAKGSDSDDDDDDDSVDRLPGLSLDSIELQTLADESDRLYGEGASIEGDFDDDNDNSRQAAGTTVNESVVLTLAERYRASLGRLSRDALMEECNSVMQEFETAEETDRSARVAAPDDDGFVTVSYTSQVGSKRELEETATGQRRRKGQKRSRSKKQSIGASELSDFYRFQTKEKRKKSLQELRRRFEDDLAKVKKMKEDQQYRPF